MLQDLNNSWLPPLSSFNTNPTFSKKPEKNQESLKVEIKIKQGDINSKTLYIKVPCPYKEHYEGSEPDHSHSMLWYDKIISW